MRPQLDRYGHLLRKAAGWAVLASLLLAVAMAACPELHHEVHHDCDHDEHECVVTHMLDGDLSDGIPLPLIAVAPGVLAIEAQLRTGDHTATVSPLFLEDGLLVHGPPVRG